MVAQNRSAKTGVQKIRSSSSTSISRRNSFEIAPGTVYGPPRFGSAQGQNCIGYFHITLKIIMFEARFKRRKKHTFSSLELADKRTGPAVPPPLTSYGMHTSRFEARVSLPQLFAGEGGWRSRPDGVWPAVAKQGVLHDHESEPSTTHCWSSTAIRRSFARQPGLRPGQALPHFAEKAPRNRLILGQKVRHFCAQGARRLR